MKKVIALALSAAAALPAAALTPASLRTTAHDYYEWQARNYPVFASDAGLHTFDDRLTDWSTEARTKREAHIRALLEQLNATDISKWTRDDQIDWILFRAQLDAEAFGDRVLQTASRDPQLYVDEASNAIFSLLKKDYAPARTRALAATARLRGVPQLIAQAKQNLTEPVRLYSQFAIDSARSSDSLFDTIDTIAGDLSADERTQLAAAKRDAANAMHGFADWLEKRLPSMKAWRPIGTDNYEFMLHRILLLPMSAHDVAHLGEVELARYRALEALLPDPSLADPDPKRVADIPADQQAFLARYESREADMIRFLREKNIVTLPPYLGHFQIRQLPRRSSRPAPAAS